MNVLGIDLSSKAIDLVLLDENANRTAYKREWRENRRKQGLAVT